VSRRDSVWLADILDAIDAIATYLAEGDLRQGMVYDACRARLIEIGEAVKNINPDVLATAPEIRWRAIARMRDQLAHHYFDTTTPSWSMPSARSWRRFGPSSFG
jgi:uncharacterized protein with HEPN domain